jgi:hypothetical protein
MSTATIRAGFGTVEGEDSTTAVLGPVVEERPGVVVPVESPVETPSSEPATIPAPPHPAIGTIEARVRRGALLLDATTPGWAAKVSLDRFLMCDARCCVIGQLYGSYSKAIDSLWPDQPLQGRGKNAEVHGFAAVDCWGLEVIERSGIGFWAALGLALACRDPVPAGRGPGVTQGGG